MKKPNFFIIGAPKCGTTSLASWLAEHPQIFFSKYKESHHFNTDHNNYWFSEREHYEELFRDAKESHRAVGEGSVWYLYSRVAVPNIEKYAPGSRYIVCLRNPVEMVYSLHEQQLVEGNEHIAEFHAAWGLRDARVKGESVSRWCRDPRHLAYGHACLLGSQLQRLYEHVPRERVHTVLLDDVKVDPREVYLSVLEFLGLDDDGRSSFERKNPAKERRSMALNHVVQTLGNLKRGLGIRRGLGVLNAIDKKNLRIRPRPLLSDKMRYELQDYFRDDIALLESLLDRDLSHWLT